MKYAIYVKQGDNEPEVFLQSSDHLERIKKDRATVDRWLYEMGVTITRFKTTRFTVYADGVATFRRNLMGAGSRSWSKVDN